MAEGYTDLEPLVPEGYTDLEPLVPELSQDYTAEEQATGGARATPARPRRAPGAAAARG